MSKLVTDDFVRTTAKVALLAIMLAIFLICCAFLLIVIGRLIGTVDSDWVVANAFLQALTVAFKTEFSGFITIIIGVFPALVSSVCYELEGADTARTVSDRLNRTGHLFFILIILGILLSMANIMLLSADDGQRSVASTANKEPLKSLFTGILSFLSIYLVQILGLKPK